MVFIWYDERMEKLEFSGQDDRPELDLHKPGELFSAAKALERRIRRKIKPEDQNRAIDHLVNNLETFISEVFDGELPEIVAQGDDVSYLVNTSEVEVGEYRLRTSRLPLRGDAALYGEHVLEGVLYNFHRGVKDDLRIFMSRQEESIITPGGLITPMYSVGVATSEVTLATDKKQERLNEPRKYINEHLLHYGEQASKDINALMNVLGNSEANMKDRLLEVSAIVAKIERQSKPTPQFIDSLLEVIWITLDLNAPQDLQVKQRRVFYTDHVTHAYKLEGAAILPSVSTQLALIGSFDDRMLNLHFLDRDQRTIHVPVRDIVFIQKSKPKLL